VAAAPTGEPRWRTLKAEHRVALEVLLDGGRRERRGLRGLIAVARPDRFRLRALGPGGLTLFDLVRVGGRVSVKESIRDAAKGVLAEVVRSLADDLSAAYQLEPAPAERRVEAAGDAVLVREPGRQVRLSRFARLPGGETFTRLDIREPRYTVAVDVVDVELDAALDPNLFAD
jgi:hypothetical protein